MKKKRVWYTITSLFLVLVLLVPTVSAAVTSILVWGARSINSQGNSDYSVSLDSLKDDYSSFLRTDGLTEYFYREQSTQPKYDMSEALAWLIDNQIFNRDERISIYGINSVPEVSIEKSNINSKLYVSVNRSDALMYLYKSVFGVLEGRTIAIETPAVRTSGGINVLLRDMLNNSTKTGIYKYTPQGDEYTGVFGDTNIFITENNIDQEVTGGTAHEDGYVGDTDGTINYVNEFPEMEYEAASDLLFYNTSDVVEMYLQALLSKGILEADASIRSEKFKSTFYSLAGATKLASWSGDAYPYVVNANRVVSNRVDKVLTAPLSSLLGENYTIQVQGSNITINRINLFKSNTGYFKTEELSRMDLYRYIYYMVYANEKKLSNLERDLVNYKYGMEFDGIATQEDIDILKYLVAKGILDFDGSNELNDLYGSVSWYDFIPILYRVANHNARLNFSAIQLTDSEQSWKSKGFYPQTAYFAEEGSVGQAEFQYDPEYLGSNVTGDEGDRPSLMSFSGILASIAQFFGATKVNADTNAGLLKYQIASSGAMTFGGYYFDFQGATYTPTTLISEFKRLLAAVDVSPKEQLTHQSSAGFDVRNPKHHIVAYMLKNVYVVSMLQSDRQLYTTMSNILDAWEANQPSTMTDKIYQTKLGVAGGLRYMLDCAVNKTGAPYDTEYTLTNGIRTSTPGSAGDIVGFARQLESIKFSMSDTTNGLTYNYTFAFRAGSVADRIGKTDIVTAVNSSAVEFSRRVPASELQAASNISELIQKFTQNIGTSLINPNDPSKNTAASGFKQFVDAEGRDAFVSWKDIEEAMAAIDLSIIRVSDRLLYNADTNTYAYFSEKTLTSKPVALVGTAVVTGDKELGVAFPSGEGESATYYYHMDAIRALINASQDSAVISGVRVITVQDSTFANYVTSIPLVSETGFSDGDVTGMTVLISKEAAKDSQKFSSDSSFNNSLKANDTMWGQYLTLSQANRVMNIVTRKLKYTPIGSTSDTPVTAYAVVRFVPINAKELGAVAVNANTSLQDLLDSPAKPPSDAAAREIWNKNKADCNAFANWIYDTHDEKYIETGYLRPEATIYVLGEAYDNIPPSNIFTPLSPEAQRSIQLVTMGKVYEGAVCALSEVPNVNMITDNKRINSYWLATNCDAVVKGDRVYLHRNLFYKLSINRSSAGATFAKVNNQQLNPETFTVGSSFKLASVGTSLFDGSDTPSIKVISIDKDYVKCQVGPIQGMPLVYGGTSAVVDTVRDWDGSKIVGTLDFTDSKSVNKVISVFREMFGGLPNIKLGGIAKEPVLSAYKAGRYFVFTGESIRIYDSGDTRPLSTIPIPSAVSEDTLSSYRYSLQSKVAGYSSVSIGGCETYIEVLIPLLEYKVENGILRQSSVSAMEYVSPSLFTSLNDLIIDSMMAKNSNAIPVNEIPSGALLKLGTGYYQAHGTSTANKTFVGYAYVDSSTVIPTTQAAAISFANHFILAGNQYINVSHFFKQFELLGSVTAEERAALSNVASSVLTTDLSPKYCIDTSGNISTIAGSADSNVAKMYTGVRIAMADGLYAYKVSGDDSSTARYVLCNNAASAISGVLDSIPFFSTDVLDSDLYQNTTDSFSSGFSIYGGVDNLRDSSEKEYQRSFASDLITLARMLVFIVLFWLILASWICYFARLGNLLPILEAIRYPTNNQSRKGIDLMKIVSLGTITLDTKFGLGRFILYDLILAALICVVMLTGRITLP